MTDAKLEEMIEDSEFLFKRLVELDNDSASSNLGKQKLLRDWWLISANILRYINDKGARNERVEPFPIHLIARLAKLSEDLAGGNIHAIIQDVSKKGALSLGERECIAVAIRYKAEASAGNIDDKRSTKTVTDAFGVSPQAVQKWMREKEARLHGVHDPGLTPEQLATELKLAGDAYRKWGYYGRDKSKTS